MIRDGSIAPYLRSYEKSFKKSKLSKNRHFGCFDAPVPDFPFCRLAVT